MTDRTFDRRTLVANSARVAALAIASGGAASLLAACGQKEQAAVSIPTGLAEPGSTIPSSNLTWAMAPYPDETLAVIGMRRGYFKDVGITIGPTSTGAKFDLTE